MLFPRKLKNVIHLHYSDLENQRAKNSVKLFQLELKETNLWSFFFM